MPKLHSLILLLALSLAACGDDFVGPQYNVMLHIQGTVTNAATGAPIEGAHVRQLFEFDFEVLTNAEGRYTLSQLKESCYSSSSVGVVAIAEGYYYFSDLGAGGEGLVSAKCTEDTQIVNIRLTPR
jgi:hypothetical protein